jgi:hypothetical protein
LHLIVDLSGTAGSSLQVIDSSAAAAWEGIKEKPYHIDRTGTCMKLRELLNRGAIVFMKAPPQSG